MGPRVELSSGFQTEARTKRESAATTAPDTYPAPVVARTSGLFADPYLFFKTTAQAASRAFVGSTTYQTTVESNEECSRPPAVNPSNPAAKRAARAERP